jgi:DNA-binding NarL/FixJ family response regulator
MSQSPTPIRVALVEDNTAWRNALERLIRATDGLELARAYPNAELALHGLPKDRPEVVLVDVQLPRLSGIACVARLKPLLPATQFVMLSVHEDSEPVLEALRAGACGYLAKSASPAEILEAIREVHRGGSPMTGHIARKVVESFHAPGAPSNGVAMLSAREREILELLAAGDRYKEIAARLEISVLTVRTHIRHIYEKLQVRSRTEAAVKFIQS